MASTSSSSRKKQDEKHLKVLRELGAVPPNKYCFDCQQRGPTYVNVTIGSFVCTKCSGMLRGLTPPHRVKSISMATFSSDEIDLLRSRGNEYCRLIWLGLYERDGLTQNVISDGGSAIDKSAQRDDLAIHDLMVDKYEKKRYYLDPKHALKNHPHHYHQQIITHQDKFLSVLNNSSSSSCGNRTNRSNSDMNLLNIDNSSATAQRSGKNCVNLGAVGMSASKSVMQLSGVATANGGNDFWQKPPPPQPIIAANVSNVDLMSSMQSYFPAEPPPPTPSTHQNHHQTAPNLILNGVEHNNNEDFANFDANPIFNSVTQLSNDSPSNSNTLPGNTTMMNNVWNNPSQPSSNGPSTNNSVNNNSKISTSNRAPNEDRYAALKDLDNALKQTQSSSSTANWTTFPSSSSSTDLNGVIHRSNSVFAAQSQPSQANGNMNGGFQSQFYTKNVDTFQAQLLHNPFNNGHNSNSNEYGLLSWSLNNTENSTNPIGATMNNNNNSSPNPFRDFSLRNGFHPQMKATFTTPTSTTPSTFSDSNSSIQWSVNPFKFGNGAISSSSSTSTNPFL